MRRPDTADAERFPGLLKHIVEIAAGS